MRSDTRTSHRKRKGTSVALLSGVIALAALAGCIQLGDPIEELGAPTAVLNVDREERWVGEPFTFDGTESRVSEDAVAAYRLDLGDGTVIETDNKSDLVVNHEYEHGAVYEVNLTVTERSEDGTNRTDNTTIKVAVHERLEFLSPPLAALPIDSPTASWEHPFTMRTGASAWEIDVSVESQAVLGDSEVTVQIRKDNQTIAEESATLGPGEDTILRFAADMPEPGSYQVNVTAESGSVLAETMVRIYYDPSAA